MRVIKSTIKKEESPRISFVSDLNPLKEAKSNRLVRKIALPTMEGYDFEKIEDIISIEAKGNYAMLFFKNEGRLLVCKTLRDIEEIINCHNQFVRIHRSFTINLNCIKKYIKGKGGYVLMEDGSSIRVSTGRKQDFIKSLTTYFG